MVKQLNFEYFRKEFYDYGRENQFSLNGLKALYDFMLEYEETTGITYKLDVIGLCTEFTEYGSIEDVKKAYGIEEWEDLSNYTLYQVFDDGVIIQNF